MTFSLVGRCEKTGMLGVVIASSSPAVAARCSHARAKIGAVASQNVTDPRLGPMVLNALECGHSITDALYQLDSFMDYRQVLVVDRFGMSAIYSGTKALGVTGDFHDLNVAAAGNLLASDKVPEAMVAEFQAKRGHIGDRLMRALAAGLAEGGEAGPVHSAGLLVVDQVSWPIVDLRVDWSDDDPVGELTQIWNRYKPQIDDYVQRALDPRKAPAYGVPGDEILNEG